MDGTSEGPGVDSTAFNGGEIGSRWSISDPTRFHCGIFDGVEATAASEISA